MKQGLLKKLHYSHIDRTAYSCLSYSIQGEQEVHYFLFYLYHVQNSYYYSKHETNKSSSKHDEDITPEEFSSTRTGGKENNYLAAKVTSKNSNIRHS